MVAHAIAGSHLFRVTPEPQAARNDAVQESVETCRGETVFDEKRRAVLGLLGFDPEAPTVTGGNGDQHALVAVFVRLLDVPEPALLEVIAIVMGEALAAGSAAVEAVGMELGVAMADWWQADTAFFELIRDKEVLTRIVAEVAGRNRRQRQRGREDQGDEEDRRRPSRGREWPRQDRALGAQMDGVPALGLYQPGRCRHGQCRRQGRGRAHHRRRPRSRRAVQRHAAPR
jgi:hypothetical protein